MNDIADLSWEKTLYYFSFILIEKESSFAVFKNNKNIYIIAFNDVSGVIMFLESSSFNVFRKKTLFYFLLNGNFKEENNTINEILALDQEAEVFFKEKIEENTIKNLFLSLEKTDYLKGTPIATTIFKRYNSNCLLLKEKDFIDLVLFEQGSYVNSFFGNNLGYYFNQIENSKTLLITYNPSLLSVEDFEEYNVLITKYDFSFYDVLAVLNKGNFDKLVFFDKDKIDLFFKVKILVAFYNFSQEDVFFTIDLFSNSFYIKVDFTYTNNLVSFMQFIANIQNVMKKELEKSKEDLKNFYKLNYKLNYDYLKLDKKFVGRFVLKNDYFIIDCFLKVLSEKIKYDF